MEADVQSPERNSSWSYRFTALPKQFFQHSIHLTPSETNVYLFIIDRLNGQTRTGWTIPISDAEIVEATGYRRETVNRARNGLVRKGILIQTDSTLRAKRVFFIAPPEDVFQMKLIFLALILREARKEDIQVQKHERTITSVCATNHTSVSKLSHNTHEANAVKPDIEHVSDDSASLGKDISCSKDISKDSLSVEPSSEEKPIDRKENLERENFADDFYQTVLNRPLTNRIKRIGIDKYFKRRVADIAADERVDNEQQACEILRDAFVRVKQEVHPIFSHKIFDVEFGESAIEKAICAAQEATHDDISLEVCVESDSPEIDAPTPSQVEIDAALLETWSDERWDAWVDEQVAERGKVRQIICAQFPEREPLTQSELSVMRQELLARYPETEAQRLDWLKARVNSEH